MLSLEFQFFASILLGRCKITTIKGFDFFLFISVKFQGSIFCPYNDDIYNSEFTTHGHEQTRQFEVTSAKVTPKGSLVRESYHVSSGHFGRLMCTTPTWGPNRPTGIWESYPNPLNSGLRIYNTLLGTNISPEKSILKMIFLFPRWDMLISWRVNCI